MSKSLDIIDDTRLAVIANKLVVDTLRQETLVKLLNDAVAEDVVLEKQDLADVRAEISDAKISRELEVFRGESQGICKQIVAAMGPFRNMFNDLQINGDDKDHLDDRSPRQMARGLE